VTARGPFREGSRCPNISGELQRYAVLLGEPSQGHSGDFAGPEAGQPFRRREGKHGLVGRDTSRFKD
jgi:hypothetical protein